MQPKTKQLVILFIPVFQTINDQQVLVPQVYFCNATLNANKQQTETGGQIYSNVGTVTLIAAGTDANISNSGYISSNNLTNIISQGNFTNTGGVMNSNQGDININANSVLITNSTDQNNQIQNVSKLTAGNGNIDITSTNDLNIQSAYIQALKNIMLTSTAGSVNLTQNSSTSFMQNADLITTSNSQSVSNDIIAYGNLSINAAQNINILAGKNTNYQYYHTDVHSNLFEDKRTTDINYNEENVANNLTGNNVLLNSNGNVNIIGSNVNSLENIDINADNVTILSNVLQSYSEHDKEIKGLTSEAVREDKNLDITNAKSLLYSENGNININSKNVLLAGGDINSNSKDVIINALQDVIIGDVKDVHQEYTYKKDRQFNEWLNILGSFALSNVYGIYNTAELLSKPKEVIDSSFLYNETSISSNITANNLTINANDDIGITGSKLLTTNDMTLSATDQLVISAAKEQSILIQQHIEEWRDYGAAFTNMFTGMGTGAAVGAGAGAAGGAIAGSIFPGPGTAAGAGLGAMIGAITGAVAGAIDGLKNMFEYVNVSVDTVTINTNNYVNSVLFTENGNISLLSNAITIDQDKPSTSTTTKKHEYYAPDYAAIAANAAISKAIEGAVAGFIGGFLGPAANYILKISEGTSFAWLNTFDNFAAKNLGITIADHAFYLGFGFVLRSFAEKPFTMLVDPVIPEVPEKEYNN